MPNANPESKSPQKPPQDGLRINFVLPPSPKISGGPLAILEYANRFIDRGHSVTITTYPDSMWEGDNPFPWFDFKGTIHYKRARGAGAGALDLTAPLGYFGQNDFDALAQTILANYGLGGLHQVALNSMGKVPERAPFERLLNLALLSTYLIEVTPECDLNIATLWETAPSALWSQKGKPVYFMQHYEEVFYPIARHDTFCDRLLARLSYMLPMYKVANSSWLQKVIRQRFGQDIPFSNNGVVLSDFCPRAKKSSADGVVRIFTYSRPEDWKGFGDAVAAMAMVRARYGARVEWHVFGYRHLDLVEDNQYAPYTYHPKLSFRELAELYATCDIALCPSWYESFPLPPLEAMASGTAVVTTDYGTEDYAFHEKNALVIGSRDVKAMFEAVCRLVDDEELRQRLEARGLETAKQFTWENAVARREQILLDIHHERVGYDRFSPAKIGLVDGLGVEFECAPADVSGSAPGLLWRAGSLYLVEGGVKRHITNPSLITPLVERDYRYIDSDSLSFVRMPAGFPIASPADLPPAPAAGPTTAISGSAVALGKEASSVESGDLRKSQLFWHGGHLYLIHEGRRHHVSNAALIPIFEQLQIPEAVLDSATFVGMPFGLPVSTPADLLANLLTLP